MDGNHRIMIAFRACITGGRLDILADDNDGEQHQLQKSLRDPCHNNTRVMRSDRSRKRDECEKREYVRAPHGAECLSDAHCQASIDPSQHTTAMDFLIKMV